MPIEGRLTAIEQRIVTELTEGLLIKGVATEMKSDTRTLATFIKNSNINSRKGNEIWRNLSARDLRKIRRRSCTQPKQYQWIHFCKSWSHIKVQTGLMQCAECDGTEHQIYIPRPQLTTEMHKNEFPTNAIYGWGPCYPWRARRMGRSLNPNETPTPYKFRHQQQSGGIGFWVGTIGDKLCGIF